jgi:hypothetical protein
MIYFAIIAFVLAATQLFLSYRKKRKRRETQRIIDIEQKGVEEQMLKFLQT